MNTNEQQLTYQTVPKMMTTEVALLTLIDQFKVHCPRLKLSLFIKVQTKSLRYGGLVTNLPDRFLTSAADTCVSSHGSECSGSLATDFSQGVYSSGLSE